MKIRRFEAENSNAALAMVKKEMGSAAVILATRTLTDRTGQDGSGLLKTLGRTGRPRVEVVAAMDYDLENLTGIQDDVEKQQVNTPMGESRPEQAIKHREPNFFPRKRPAAEDTRRHFAGILSRQPQPAARAMGRKAAGAEINRPDPDQVSRWRRAVIDQIQVGPLQINNDGPTAIALVGATGVGKTTTIAKLAAWFSLRERKKVALISMDCYRIGATDQLRTYGRIMHLPCEITLDHADLQQAIERHRDKDIILIDTAGKSPYDRSYVSELAQWFEPCGIIKPYLVLSATSQKENIAKVLENYGRLGLKGLILSKLDETKSYAALCQELASSPLSVAALCTGQRVPEDFRMASRAFVDKLFGEGWSALPEELGFVAQEAMA